MVTDKSNMLCILHILEEYTDENHVLSTKDIMAKMSQLYDKSVDRRTIYGAIEALQNFGYDISTRSDNGQGYCLISRQFSSAEVKLLIDAVYSCEYISSQQTKELLEKLRGFLSSHDRKNYNYTNIIAPDKKTQNKEVFLNIEILEQAINEKKMVSFTYMDYDYDKKLKPKRDKAYIANPYSMLCEGSHYYLVLITEGHTSPGFYRIDMMKDIHILDKPLSISKREAKLDSAKRVVYAHYGEPRPIELHCDKNVLRYVLEEFGNDILITKNEDGTFNANFTAAVSDGLVYWALQYMQGVEVLQPADLRQKVMQAIQNNKYNV